MKRDGTELHGYVFNRDADGGGAVPRVLRRPGRRTLPLRYAEVATIHFTGKDTAAGQ